MDLISKYRLPILTGQTDMILDVDNSSVSHKSEHSEKWFKYLWLFLSKVLKKEN